MIYLLQPTGSWFIFHQMMYHPKTLRPNLVSVVQQTSVVVDDSKPWQIALKEPTTSLAFSGFTQVADIPFDRAHPAAKIRAQAKLTTDGVYRKGNVPNSPVRADQTTGSLFEVDLVPLAHSYLRLTVLPVLADDRGQELDTYV